MGNQNTEHAENHTHTPERRAPLQNTAFSTEKAPQLLTKKWLAVYFGFMRPGGGVYYQGLYRHVLTADVLERAGLSMEKVRCRQLKTFDRTSSMHLIEILGLQ